MLRCGVLDYSFLRVRCDACRQDPLVAFSCKKRGVCLSCSARRASDTAAHLTDHLTDNVLPRVSYRQWVFTLLYRLRLLLSRERISGMNEVFRRGPFYVTAQSPFHWNLWSVRENGKAPDTLEYAFDALGGAENDSVQYELFRNAAINRSG